MAETSQSNTTNQTYPMVKPHHREESSTTEPPPEEEPTKENKIMEPTIAR